MELHQIIKEARCAKGLTQEQVAKYLGQHVRTYEFMETNWETITATDLIQLAKLLDIDLNELKTI